jgi:hypothetical protein
MRRLIILIAGLVAAAAAGAAAASALTSGGSSPPTRSATPQDPAPNDQPAVDARTRNPSSGRPDLGVVVYRNRSGDICSAAGEVQAGRVGTRQNGRFEEMPLGQGGTCGDVRQPVSAHVERDVQAQTIRVWGLASTAVERIEVEVDGATATARPGTRGAYIAAIPARGASGTQLTVIMRDGSEEQMRFPPFPSDGPTQGPPPKHGH